MTRYEWLVEQLDEGDIIDTCAWDTLADARKFAAQAGLKSFDICLSKDYLDKNGEPITRTWCYLVNGKMPTEFEDGNKVPSRFRKEAAQ